MINETQSKLEAPWFWRLFGGAVIGLFGTLLFTHLNTINANAEKATSEIKSQFGAIGSGLESCKTQIAVMQQTIISLEASNNSLKESIKSLREWNKESSKQINELREKCAAWAAKKQSETPKNP